MKKMIIIITGMVILIGCSKSVSNMTIGSTTGGSTTGSSTIDCSGSLRSFAKDVNPIIQSTCATGSNCHGGGSHNGPGELLVYSQIKNASADIRAAVLSGAMPKNGSLTVAEKSSIICWIDNGSSDN